jgi:acyl-CoA synthetase (AMP-forming)/AMP-acid ligase II
MSVEVTVWTPLASARKAHGERVAVVEGDRRVTYAELGAQADALARFFVDRGVAPGDRISALMVNSHAYLLTYFGVAGAGAVINPLNHRLSARDLAFILADAGARWLVADVAFADQVAALLGSDSSLEGVVWVGDDPQASISVPAVDLAAVDLAAVLAVADHGAAFAPVPRRPDDLAHLYYTSGATGQPKGVMLTHGNVCVHARGTIEELGLSADDVWGHIAPMFHLADAWATFAITWVGGQHVMVPRYDAPTVLDALVRHRVTITNLIPTMVNDLVSHPDAGACDVGSLRLLMSGGAPIAPALVKRLLDTFGCDYVQTYGMTETSPYLTLSLVHPHLRALSPEAQLVYKAKTGRPFRTVELRVVDPEGHPVAPDGQQVGEIQVRGDSVTPGYWNRPDATAAAFTDDGFLRTGDLAVLDAEGYVDIVDRLKDMIITGGENVYSTEVEHVLYNHDAVLEAAVVGVPDAKWGEAVVAVVVLRPGAPGAPGAQVTAADLIAHCKAHLAAFKAPKRVVFLESLPRTGSGKIRKQTLREHLASRPAGATV